MNSTEVMRVTPLLPSFETTRYTCEQFTVGEQDRVLSSLSYGSRYCPPGTYTRLRLKAGFQDVVMSDTPAELRDHWAPMHYATGRVLVNGLGLGCVVKGLLTKPDVTHVDVVEIDHELVVKMSELAPWCKDPRVTMHIGDALKMWWPVGTRWNYAWHDIWTHISTDNLPTYARLNRMYGGRVDQQGAWAHEIVKDYQRRGSYY